MAQKQKAPFNHPTSGDPAWAFFLTCLSAGVAIFFTIDGQILLTPLRWVLLSVEVFLGYFTMKKSIVASGLLLCLFVVDRIVEIFINGADFLRDATQFYILYIFVLITIILGYFYYSAYSYLKNSDKIETTNKEWWDSLPASEKLKHLKFFEKWLGKPDKLQ